MGARPLSGGLLVETVVLADQIAGWIAGKVGEAGAAGVVVGLSGGVDSAVVAALSARALGCSAVLGVIMPCGNISQDEEHARLVAKRLGIAVERVDIAPVFDSLVVTLPPSASALARANLKPRLRMATLYYLATARRSLVAGTGNKSELMAGYFTKHGDGGADILPIGGLYKSRVFELAHHLDVPKAIIEKPPSAGLWEGQTDEEELGITYAELDAILAALERGDTGSFDPAKVAKVEQLRRASAHKRAMPPVFVPIGL